MSCRAVFYFAERSLHVIYADLVSINGNFVTLLAASAQDYLGFRETLKRNTHSVFFVQRLDAGLEQLNLACQLNRLVPSQVRVCLVVGYNPGALAVLASLTRLFKKLA